MTKQTTIVVIGSLRVKPHFYIVRLGFTGVYINVYFLILLKYIDCGYSLELAASLRRF